MVTIRISPPPPEILERPRNLSQVAPWGELSWTTKTLGCWEASWVMPPGDWGLAVGDQVDLLDGLQPIWSGNLTEPNVDTGEYTAEGACRLAERFLALDGSGNVFGWPGVTMDAAIARGMAWNGYTGTPAVAAPILDTGALSGEPVFLSALLDTWADGIGMRWHVDADRLMRMTADPTTPRWRLHAGVARIGQGDQDFTTSLVARYLDSTTSTYKTIIVATGSGDVVREQPLDLTPRGAMSAASATTIATKVLTVIATKPGLLDPVDVDASTLTDMGGNPADPRLVRAGQMVRIPGVWNGPIPHLDVVLGQVTVNDSTGVATLTEVDAAPTDLTTVLAAIRNPRSKK